MSDTKEYQTLVTKGGGFTLFRLGLMSCFLATICLTIVFGLISSVIIWFIVQNKPLLLGISKRYVLNHFKVLTFFMLFCGCCTVLVTLVQIIGSIILTIITPTHEGTSVSINSKKGLEK
eukprot:gene11942-5343_t